MNKTEELIMQIANAAHQLGWTIALPNNDEEDLQGLIIGKDSYVNNILSYLPDEPEKTPTTMS